jgi:hypothetical protein
VPRAGMVPRRISFLGGMPERRCACNEGRACPFAVSVIAGPRIGTKAAVLDWRPEDPVASVLRPGGRAGFTDYLSIDAYRSLQ